MLVEDTFLAYCLFVLFFFKGKHSFHTFCQCQGVCCKVSLALADQKRR